MNLSPPQNLSIYQLAMEAQTPPKRLNLSCVTLLSMLKSQVDLLIEQKISATVVVKFPPLNIFYSELKRYQQHLGDATIYDCQLGEVEEIQTNVVEGFDVNNSDEYPSITGLSHDSIQLVTNNRQIRREYFLIILSGEFCSFILAHRPRKKLKKPNLNQKNNSKIPSLVTIQTFNGEVIQRVLDGINNFSNLEKFNIATSEFVYPQLPQAALTSQLFLMQVKRQEEICSRKYKNRFGNFKQQNQTLRSELQAKDEYLRNVCQELLVPLTHVKTALSLLNSPSIKAPQRQRYLDMIKRECDRQNYLITGVMDLVELERNLENTF